MKQLPIIRRGNELKAHSKGKGPKVSVVSRVPRTVPRYPVPADPFVLQDPDGFPIFDTSGQTIYDNVTNP